MQRTSHGVIDSLLDAAPKAPESKDPFQTIINETAKYLELCKIVYRGSEDIRLFYTAPETIIDLLIEFAPHLQEKYGELATIITYESLSKIEVFIKEIDQYLKILKAMQQNEFIFKEDHELLLKMVFFSKEPLIANYKNVVPDKISADGIREAKSSPPTTSAPAMAPSVPEIPQNSAMRNNTSSSPLIKNSALKSGSVPELTHSTLPRYKTRLKP